MLQCSVFLKIYEAHSRMVGISASTEVPNKLNLAKVRSGRNIQQKCDI
jgi:hypothetical protein